LLKHPKDAFISQKNINKQWQELNYLYCPDYEKAIEEYDQFVSLLKNQIPDIYFLPRNKNTGLDSIYLHDPVIITNRGAILGNMGKELRKDEPHAIKKFLQDNQIPILGEITGEGKLEGGDVIWLNQKTVAIGIGYRTNIQGIKQFREMVKQIVDTIIQVPLPHWKGPDDVLHLMSIMSPIDHNLAAIYSKLMPVPFRQWLISRGYRFIEIPEDEYETMACNILTIAPKKCLLLEGNPKTKKMLQNEHVEVHGYHGEEISKKGAGGPTCLTRPIYRVF
jgi:N-dimethylarginine dimethylaminohydrolase